MNRSVRGGNRRLESVVRWLKSVDFRNRECNEPDESFNVLAVHEWMWISVRICEAAGVETPLPVVSQKEVLALRYAVRDLAHVAARGGMLVRFALVACAEVRFRESYFFASTPFLEVHVTATERDGVTWHANDTFDVVLLSVIRWSKDHHVAVLRITEVVGEFVDDDVLLVLEGTRHGASFHLKRRDEECANDHHDRHNDDDIENDIEEMEPEAVLFLLHPPQYRGGSQECIACAHAFHLMYTGTC